MMKQRVFSISNSEEFQLLALEIFEIQAKANPVYAKFVETLGCEKPTLVNQIPLLPVEAFRRADVITKRDKTRVSGLIFESSGTSSMAKSKHIVPDESWYRESVLKGFDIFYPLAMHYVIPYLPGYVENPHSSLIKMAGYLVEYQDASYIASNPEDLIKEIGMAAVSGKTPLLLGAAFGLVDIAETSLEMPRNTIILETGGMKTYRREMTRKELRHTLASGFGLPLSHVRSEYGMCELLSQAYSGENEAFRCPPWMKMSIRNPENPFEEMPAGQEGLIGVVDLANFYSCSFILTGDKGAAQHDGSIQILGRWNSDDLRGCNFLIDGE